ncbi:pantothenate kinase, putative [Eimeria mitis]|uniref:Pantothenate kinase, putative n=1 Tax=Eimeria mitis TaxID=44415 RepID=U6JU34_9EIME|nr:pantothenate kinase, putative [Eimeria mitis]CDJ28899.1 pantothenate kinase, putative [Eimeria mitis]
MESITQGVNFYMQQYDQHTPQTCLRGPASPLLAAPPNFNVSAQQRILLQQQLLTNAEAAKQQGPAVIDRELKATGSDGPAAAAAATAAADAVGAADAAVAAAAVVLPPHGASEETAASELCGDSMVGASSPVAMPSRPQIEGPSHPQPGQLHEQQQQQQHGQQEAASTGNNLRSPSCPPLGISRSSIFSPPTPASPQDAVATEPAASWAPFEVLFLRHDGYLGAVGALVAPGPNTTPPPT